MQPPVVPKRKKNRPQWHLHSATLSIYPVFFFFPLSKTQVALLTKYLWIGKYCYESRNFATAMQVLRGLENVIVRQLPVRLHLKKIAPRTHNEFL